MKACQHAKVEVGALSAKTCETRLGRHWHLTLASYLTVSGIRLDRVLIINTTEDALPP